MKAYDAVAAALRDLELSPSRNNDAKLLKCSVSDDHIEKRRLALSFARGVLRALEAASGLTTGYEVWREVHRGVTKEYPQSPQYDPVLSACQVDAGEFLFSTTPQN